MKHIKSYRLFESRSNDILELLDLGIISPEDLPELINGLDESEQPRLVHQMVERYGLIKTIKLFYNNNKIIRQAYGNNPLNYMDQFSNLEQIEIGSKIYYLDGDKTAILMHSSNKPVKLVLIIGEIWSFFTDVFDLTETNTTRILSKWFEDTYGLTTVTVTNFYFEQPIIK